MDRVPEDLEDLVRVRASFRVGVRAKVRSRFRVRARARARVMVRVAEALEDLVLARGALLEVSEALEAGGDRDELLDLTVELGA